MENATLFTPISYAVGYTWRHGSVEYQAIACRPLKEGGYEVEYEPIAIYPTTLDDYKCPAEPVKNAENAGPTPSESQPSGPQRSLLVVKVPSRIHQEDVESLSRYMEPMGAKLGAEVMICPDGMDAQWQQNLQPLVEAIAAQTEAITRLAMSNEALVQAMGQDEPEDPETPPSRYMDGSPVL